MTTARTDGTALRLYPVHDSPLLQTCSDGRRARMRETVDAVCRTNDSGKCSATMRRRHIGYTAQQQHDTSIPKSRAGDDGDATSWSVINDPHSMPTAAS